MRVWADGGYREAGCEYFEATPSYCPLDSMEDEDFDPEEMCCVCGGGITGESNATILFCSFFSEKKNRNFLL